MMHNRHKTKNIEVSKPVSKPASKPASKPVPKPASKPASNVRTKPCNPSLWHPVPHRSGGDDMV
jgi:hypothetical protein